MRRWRHMLCTFRRPVGVAALAALGALGVALVFTMPSSQQPPVADAYVYTLPGIEIPAVPVISFASLTAGASVVATVNGPAQDVSVGPYTVSFSGPGSVTIVIKGATIYVFGPSGSAVTFKRGNTVVTVTLQANPGFGLPPGTTGVATLNAF